MLRRGLIVPSSFVLRECTKRHVRFSCRITQSNVNPVISSFATRSFSGSSSGSSDVDTSPNVREAEILSDVEIGGGQTIREAEVVSSMVASHMNDSSPSAPFNEYVGEYDSEGRPHGKGKRVWDGAAGFRNEYEGDWVNGVIEGKGVYTVNGEVLYEGDFERSMFHGTGKLKVKNATYEGQMFDNRMHGHGKMKYDNGAIYTGEFVRGKKYGECVYQYPDGDVYEGGIDNDMMVGRGVLRFAQGTNGCCLCVV